MIFHYLLGLPMCLLQVILFAKRAVSVILTWVCRWIEYMWPKQAHELCICIDVCCLPFLAKFSWCSDTRSRWDNALNLSAPASCMGLLMMRHTHIHIHISGVHALDLVQGPFGNYAVPHVSYAQISVRCNLWAWFSAVPISRGYMRSKKAYFA